MVAGAPALAPNCRSGFRFVNAFGVFGGISTVHAPTFGHTAACHSVGGTIGMLALYAVRIIYKTMIRSFRDRDTEHVFARAPVRRFQAFQRIAYRKLLMLDAATAIEDLRSPPGNRLEKLSGDRSGQWSIRINDQWRLCFEWSDGDALEVEIVDYHK
jgi:proteic killer suppression protein